MPRDRRSTWNTGTLIVYITSLVLLFMYISAATSPPPRHVELAASSFAVDGDWPLMQYTSESHDNTQREWDGSARSTPLQSSYLQRPSGNHGLSPTITAIWLKWSHVVEDSVDRVGDFLAMLLGIDDIYGDVEDETTTENVLASTQSGFSTWAESSIYVERTRALYPSRPSSFGPHILHEPVTALLYPISSIAPTNASACASNSSLSDPDVDPPSPGWIGLIERGHCSFSTKVRYAQERGAVAVVFGDQHRTDGGIKGIGGLLTPWSPDDTSDIRIPSVFVSRSSYLALLDTWAAEQDFTRQSRPRLPPKGLMVTLSGDELFAWPLLDLLILVLFLPSFLTLLTVFSQRLRVVRQRQRDRAPPSIVASLPVFTWGEPDPQEQEKKCNATPEAVASRGSDDEERTIGVTATGPGEATRLLPPSAANATPNRQPAPSWTSWTSVVRVRALRLFGLDGGRPRKVQLAPRKAKHLYPRYGSMSGDGGMTPNTVECAICLCDFENGDKVMELPCGHFFHEAEITPWLLDTRRHCPICRASITLDSEDESSRTLVATQPATAAAAAVLPASLPVTLPVTTASAVRRESEAVSSSAPAALATTSRRGQT